LLTLSSKKRPALFLHGLVLVLPLALVMPVLRALDTPLRDGIYRAVRGYNAGSEGCPRSIVVAGVKIINGTVSFTSGDAEWQGMTDQDNGVIRIEAAGLTPKPTGDFYVRGHYSRAELFSAFCGSGYFRILR
jgi:hypothetical protein